MTGPLEPAVASKISVVITTRNEGRHIRHLLDSLAPQVGLYEVLLVDAESSDDTVAIAKGYESVLPRLQIVVRRCRRGEGRNIGAAMASGDYLAFIDGDCIANAFWLQRMMDAASGDGAVLAGQTILTGFWAFTKLHRVELPHRGHDTTWPSCNLLYPRKLFEQVGGFDSSFVTAEDIDLNYRAVEAGAPIRHVDGAIVYARARESIVGFLRQAYWNGYGRKQLTAKHGRLWHQYPITSLIRLHGGSFWGLLRIGWGLLGYTAAKLGRKPQ